MIGFRRSVRLVILLCLVCLKALSCQAPEDPGSLDYRWSAAYGPQSLISGYGKEIKGETLIRAYGA